MIRVGLEPGYDRGRFGAWFLDWPGAFVWAATETTAIAAAPAAIREFHDWLAVHGTRLEAPAGDIEIVERVPARVVNGYEINAIFSVDRPPARRTDLERALAWLAFARRDIDQVLSRTEAQGEDALTRATPILIHLARAEVWLASRLGVEGRYEGPLDAATLTATLAATRTWADRELVGSLSRDPYIERVDRHGEVWTIRKVCRRLVYHSLDHLGEIQQLDRLTH